MIDGVQSGDQTERNWGQLRRTDIAVEHRIMPHVTVSLRLGPAVAGSNPVSPMRSACKAWITSQRCNGRGASRGVVRARDREVEDRALEPFRTTCDHPITCTPAVVWTPRLWCERPLTPSCQPSDGGSCPVSNGYGAGMNTDPHCQARRPSDQSVHESGALQAAAARRLSPSLTRGNAAEPAAQGARRTRLSHLGRLTALSTLFSDASSSART